MLFRHHLPCFLVFFGMGCSAGKALEARWLEIGVGLWWTRLLVCCCPCQSRVNSNDCQTAGFEPKAVDKTPAAFFELKKHWQH